MFGTTSVPIASLPLATGMQLGFFVMLGIYAIFTAILYYHWNTYADNRVVSRLTFVLYFLLTLPFMGVIGITAFTI